MPFSIRKIPNKKCYKVENTRTKRVFARCTTKKRAESQLRLLRALEYNKNFVFRPEKRKILKKPRKTQKRKRKNV